MTTAAIGEAVARLLADGSSRDRAAELAAEIATMPLPADVANVLEALRLTG